MTMLIHLIRADVRRLRLVLAALLILTLGGVALAMARPLAVEPRWVMSLAAAGTLTWVARILVTLLTAAMLIHTHTLVGTTSFWLTRPIPRMLLLASKSIVLALLLVALPIACELVFMSLYDVPLPRMALVATQTALLQLLWMTVLMCGASITRNVAAFGLLIGGSVVALAVAMLMLPLFLLDPDNGVAATAIAINVAPLQPVDSGSDVLFALFVLASGAAMLVVQYRTRSRWRALAALAVGIGIAWTISAVWPWPLLQRQRAVPGWASADRALVLSATPPEASFEEETQWAQRGERKWWFGRSHLQLDGIEPGWRARLRLAASAIVLEDGTHLEGRGVAYGEDVPIDRRDLNQERAVVGRVLAVDRLGGYGDYNRGGNISLVLPTASLLAHRGASGAYAATFVIELSRVDVVATLPIQPGAGYQEDAARFRIDDVRYGASGLVLRMRRSNATTLFDRHAPRFYTYYLRNRTRREAVLTSLRHPLQESMWFPFAASHVSLDSAFGFAVAQEHVVPAEVPLHRAPFDPPAPQIVIAVDRDWLADAELVIARTTEAGTVTRTLEIRGFRMVGPRSPSTGNAP